VSEPFPGRSGPRRRAEWPWLLGYVPLAIALTWPLSAHLCTRLAGDHGDAWQTLWGFEWLRRALAAGQNPFFTHDLWHPDGTTLVFQTFDLPDALLALVLRLFVGPIAAYDLVTLGTYVFSGVTMYALGRGTGASRPASFLSGCAYTFSTFHFGHALGHLHILAMQWVPLYALCLVRVLDGGRLRWAVAGGVALAFSAASSWYHLFGASFVTAGLVIAHAARERGKGLARPAMGLGAIGASFAVLMGPLAWATLRARASEAVSGQHSPQVFSADLQSFFLPNAASALSSHFPAFRAWSGNGAENASYVGYVLVALVLAGVWLRAPRVGAWLVVAALGVLFSLGPALKWGGRAVTGDVMPYALLVKALPVLSFAGVPVRFAFAATFGLSAALAPALDAIAARLRWRWALVLGGLAVLEHVPHAFVTSTFPTPAPMIAWAKDRADFAVLDACRDMRPLWHQTLHGRPIMGGYVTRTPTRLEEKLAADPVAGPLLAWDVPERVVPITSPSLDLPFREPVAPGAEATRFSIELRGILRVPADGGYTFHLGSDDGAQLFVDAHRVVDNGGEHPYREASGARTLTRGLHVVSVRYTQVDGEARLAASWSGPGFDRRVLGPEDVPDGFEGRARFRQRATSLGRDEALAHLRSLKVAHVVVDLRESRYLLETQLGLAPAYVGDGVRVYEVPRP
jgi:hypothetical protein